MNDINSILNNSMTAISILLVFITILFDIKYPKVQKIMGETIAKDKPREKKYQKEKFKNVLISQWSYVILLNFICAYLMTPLAIKTIQQSSFNLINFDFIKTAFILIWILIILFFIASLRIAIKICCKIRKCK